MASRISPPERITNNPDDTIENEFLNAGYTFEHRFSENWKIRNAFRYLVNDYNYGGDDDVLALPFAIDDETGILTRVFSDQQREEDSFTLYTNIEGNFTTGKVRHNVLFGVDLNHSESKQLTNFDPVPASFAPLDVFDPDYDAIPEPDDNVDSIGLFNDDEISTDRLGVYIQDKIDLFDNLILLAGLRYDVVDQTQTDNLTDTEQTQNNDDVTPRVGLVYQPIESVSLYASYAESFNPNEDFTTAEGDLLEPETGEGFEVGIKAELIRDRLSATVAYFDITKQNVATADPDDPFVSIATGERQSQGVELDLIGEILPGWNIIASYAYIDAEITEDNEPGFVGSRLPNIPEHSANLWTTYEIRQGDLEGLGFGIGFNFVGEREGGLPNSFEVDSYFLTNAAIYYSRQNWQLRLNFDNLFDVEFIEAVENSRVRGIYPGEPFTVRGLLSVQF
ncbi:MAG: TonB-dependent siderophore receptor [Cyanophyceae cyanobacterium]